MTSRLSSITGKSRYTTLPEVGRVTVSDYPRRTEIDAELLSRWGLPIPASDTIRELRDKGYKRCGRCGFYKPPTEFSTYKRSDRDTEYLHTYCKHCRAEMMRTKRWSHITPADPYPRRVG